MSNEMALPVMLGLASGIGIVILISAGTLSQLWIPLVATKANPLGFDARIAFVHNHTHSCIRSPCYDSELFMLKTTHTRPTWFLGYLVCNDERFPSCVKLEGFAGASAIPSTEQRAKPPEYWGGQTIGDPKWKVGDRVHIWVKLAPNIITLENNSEQFHIDENNVGWVDLGKSEIFEYNEREIRARI